MNTDKSYIELAKSVISSQAKQLTSVASSIDSYFIDVLEVIYSSKGKLIFSGIGKSGHIGRKVSSSFRSIGVDSVYVDPIECLHGDLGTVREGDIFFLISNSGETEEILNLLNTLRMFRVTTVAVTSDMQSNLSIGCDYILSTGAVVEVDPFNKIPTSSSIAILSLLDSLLVCLLTKNSLSLEELSKFHPAGTLYKKE